MWKTYNKLFKKEKGRKLNMMSRKITLMTEIFYIILKWAKLKLQKKLQNSKVIIRKDKHPQEDKPNKTNSMRDDDKVNCFY